MGFIGVGAGFSENTDREKKKFDLCDHGHVTPLGMCLAFSSLIERQCLEAAEPQSGLKYRLQSPSCRYRNVLDRLLLLLLMVLTRFPLSCFT